MAPHPGIQRFKHRAGHDAGLVAEQRRYVVLAEQCPAAALHPPVTVFEREVQHTARLGDLETAEGSATRGDREQQVEDEPRLAGLGRPDQERHSLGNQAVYRVPQRREVLRVEPSAVMEP